MKNQWYKGKRHANDQSSHMQNKHQRIFEHQAENWIFEKMEREKGVSAKAAETDVEGNGAENAS